MQGLYNIATFTRMVYYTNKQQNITNIVNLIKLIGITFDVFKKAKSGYLKFSNNNDGKEASSFINELYIFEFLGLPNDTAQTETQIESALISHLQQFLMELDYEVTVTDSFLLEVTKHLSPLYK